MLAKAFKIDVTICDHCGGKLKKVCAVNDRDSIRRYLIPLNIDPDPPPKAPARTKTGEFDFVQCQGDDYFHSSAQYHPDDDGAPVIRIE